MRLRGTRNRGFSLIEVLVALVVTSIGLLGLAVLQINSLRYSHSAHLRAQATLYAQDMLERLRANRQSALDGAYDFDYGAAPAGGGVTGEDITRWLGAVRGSLPNGDGAVAVDAASNIVTVAVRWDDARGQGGAENDSADGLLEFTVTSEL